MVFTPNSTSHHTGRGTGSPVPALSILVTPTAPTEPQEAARASEVDLSNLDLEAPLPLDPNGAFRDNSDNGLVYLIRANAEPAARAELRLVVNAGSAQEDEDQLGIAHLLEHMLFNGTERFEGQELVDFMEGIGMGFGPDVNAYTSFDETVYQLRIPTDDPEIVDTAFDILEGLGRLRHA